MAAAIKAAIDQCVSNRIPVVTKRLRVKRCCSKATDGSLKSGVVTLQYIVTTDGQWQLELSYMFIGEASSEQNGIQYSAGHSVIVIKHGGTLLNPLSVLSK